MKLRVKPSGLRGTISIPASKSHTIRALAIATLAQGISLLKNPLFSEDTTACINACQSLGAKIEMGKDWIVQGVNGVPQPAEGTINVMNSGATLRIMAGIASLSNKIVRLDGDAQIKKRPMQPLLTALNNLGATTRSESGNGMCPLTIEGKIKGGFTQIDSVTSQFLTSLLICSPLAAQDTHINVTNLNEKPYIEITLHWLNAQGIQYTCENNFASFVIKGKQSYKAFEQRIPADFSSATFPLVAAAITNSSILLEGLDFNDPQGDKEVFSMLEAMGTHIKAESEGIHIRGEKLQGREFDLNNTPDALPALAVLGCAAFGTTVLKNVPQARIKETDRIDVMARELSKMGARLEELPDGIILHNSKLIGATVNGHGDHRVIMALSLAGLIADGETIIEGAESLAVTFPAYVEKMSALGADMSLIN